MVRNYHIWYSEALQRDMEMLVYGYAGPKMLLFPTRTARFYDYENWNLIDCLQPLIEQGMLQVYALDSIDQESFYCFWAHPTGRIKRHVEYEHYILHEVIPFTNSRNSNPTLISAGCSMGAYHAVNIAFRHPHLFTKVIALSGRYDLCMSIENFDDLLSGYFDDTIYYHMPSRYMPNMPEGRTLQQIRALEIVIVCGLEDPFLPNNQSFSQTLWTKRIVHEFIEWNGLAHSVKHWKHMLPYYLHRTESIEQMNAYYNSAY